MSYHAAPFPSVETLMPELPEVETVRAGLTPHLTGRQIKQAVAM
mgnify:CR=1 FL=1